ncbi:MAG: HD domain-containing protein [Planctomycetota bacterium]
MPNSKLRRQIAWEAARLIYERQESDFVQAKQQAARSLACEWWPSDDLPRDSEIRCLLRRLDTLQPPEPRLANLSIMKAKTQHVESVDRFQIYEALLLPLENVQQNLKYHPEGDALYHSVQVFDHARDELPYDEEFLLAALLHDVGKGIDPYDHVHAGLEALDEAITERTAWLIEHHMLAHAIADRSIGSRAHRRLRESEHYDDLVLLGECDRAGRQPGVEAPELDEVLDYLRSLGGMFD